MPEFGKNYQELKSINEAAWNYLNRFPPHTWSRAGFRTFTKNQSILNNMSKQFNATIVRMRGKPILTMLEEIRLYLMRKMNDSKGQIARYKGPITPFAQSKLEQAKKDSNNWISLWAGDADAAKFQVQHMSRRNEKFVVDLKDYSCSCREWDLCGIPCQHAVACLGHNNLEPEQFVHPYYSKETWGNIYTPYIEPVRGEDQWEKTGEESVLPPVYNRGGGRPEKKRTKTNDVPENPYKAKRKYKVFECGKCGGKGHNSRTCKGITVKANKVKKAKRDTTASSGPSSRINQSCPAKEKNVGATSVQITSISRCTSEQQPSINQEFNPPVPAFGSTIARPEVQMLHVRGVAPPPGLNMIRPRLQMPLRDSTSPVIRAPTAGRISAGSFRWRGRPCVTRENLQAANIARRTRSSTLNTRGESSTQQSSNKVLENPK